MLPGVRGLGKRGAANTPSTPTAGNAPSLGTVNREDEQARHGDTAVSGPPERRDLPAESTLTHAEASSN
jgi:hypothetical protein